MQSLCIVPGKLVWKLVIDITLLNNDGNIYDCSTIACLASWLSYKIPFLRPQSNTVEIREDMEFINLSVLHVPVSVTFGITGDQILVDPTIQEEKVLDGLVLVSANKFGELCYLHTYSHPMVDDKIIDSILNQVKGKVDLIYGKLKEFKEGLDDRKKGGSTKDSTVVPLVDKQRVLNQNPSTELIPTQVSFKLFQLID